MRLINADEHECWACKHHATGKCDTWCDANEAFELREDVKNAPTVFDVEAVLDELEEMRSKPMELVYDVPLIDSIIECIRKGGVKNERNNSYGIKNECKEIY